MSNIPLKGKYYDDFMNKVSVFNETMGLLRRARDEGVKFDGSDTMNLDDIDPEAFWTKNDKGVAPVDTDPRFNQYSVESLTKSKLQWAQFFEKYEIEQGKKKKRTEIDEREAEGAFSKEQRRQTLLSAREAQDRMGGTLLSGGKGSGGRNSQTLLSARI